MSTVAVVILNRNGVKLLDHYLPTVIETSTTLEGAEVIVADNASTDDSLKLLAEKYPTVRTIVLDKNYGFAGGYNRAIAQLEHDYVVLLNSDVATSRDWLKPLVELLDSDATVGACAPKILDDKRHTHFEYAGAAGGYIDIFGFPFCRGRVLDSVEEDKGQYDDNADCLWVCGAALTVRRELYLEMGGLDEDFFAHMEEIDLCWRLRNKGYRIVTVGNSSIYHLGGATLSQTNPRKTYLNFRNNLWMLVKNLNTRWWVMIILGRLVLDGMAAMAYLVSGQFAFFRAVFMAHIDTYRNVSTLFAKRRRLAEGRQNGLVPEVRRLSLVWQYYIRKHRTYNILK